MPGWMKWTVALLIGFAIILVGFRFWSPLLTIFFILNCLVLVVVVLLQSGKAADLAGAFGGAGSQTAFGPRGAATILSQATTWCAVMFMVCAMALALRSEHAVGGNSVIYNRSKPASKPAAPASKSGPGSQAPANPAPATTPGGAAPAGTAPAAPAGSTQNPKK